MELVKAREMKRRIYAHDHLLTDTLWVGGDPESMEYKNCAQAFKNREKMIAEFNRLMGWSYESGY